MKRSYNNRLNELYNLKYSAANIRRVVKPRTPTETRPKFVFIFVFTIHRTTFLLTFN